MRKLSENILDKISIDFLRNQVLKNAYGNDDTVIAKLDPRILLVWYLFFGLVPWFLNDVVLLLGIFIFVALTTRAARIAPLVLFLFCIGVFSQTGYLFIVSLFFGGNAQTVVPLLVLTLKVAAVSLASITVFSGLDPDRLSNGLMWYGCPERLSFSISYAYRMLPMLMEEFQNVLLSYRLRGRAPGARPNLRSQAANGRRAGKSLPPFLISCYAWRYRQPLPLSGKSQRGLMSCIFPKECSLPPC